jgi:hypothetical protein
MNGGSFTNPRPKTHRRTRSSSGGGSTDFLQNVPFTPQNSDSDDDDGTLARIRRRFKEWMGYVISFFKNHWHLVTFVSVSGFLVGYQLYRRHKNNVSVTDSVRNALRLPTSNAGDLDPRWKIYPSRIQGLPSTSRESNELQALTAPFGMLRTRSITRIGRDAALQRYDGTIDSIKNALSLVTYRIPRAIHDWEAWISAAAYGLYYFASSGNNTPFAPEKTRTSIRSMIGSWINEKRERGREKRKRVGTRLKKLIIRPFAEEQIVEDLKNAYDKKML